MYENTATLALLDDNSDAMINDTDWNGSPTSNPAMDAYLAAFKR